MRGRPAWLGDGAIAAGVAALAAVAQLPSFDRSVVPMDEGQLLAIAGRLLDGEVLYRDIYTGIFPGVYYGTALLLRIFGEDAVVTRWMQLVLNAAVAGCLWSLGRRVMGRVWAALAPVLYMALVAFAFPTLTMVNYSSLSLTFGLFALCFLLRHLEGGRLMDAVVCGALLGACGIVKQNFGALAVLALGIGLIWARREAPGGRRATWAAGLALLGSGAALGLAMLLALASLGAVSDFVQQTLVVIYESQLEAFNDPIPPILGSHPENDSRFVFLYTPSALFNYLMRGETFFGLEVSAALCSAAIRLVYGATLACLVAGALLLWLDRRDENRERRNATRAVVVFAIVMFPGIFPLAIWSHLALILPPVLLLPGLLGQRLEERMPPGSPARHAWRAAYAAMALCALLVLGRVSLDLQRWYDQPLGISRASLFVDARLKVLLRGSTRFLSRCASPAEPVFVAPHMAILYFLAERRNPTPYDLVIPGDVKGAEIVARLEATATRCVVYSPQMYAEFAPFDELFPEVARLLDESYRRAVVIQAEGTEWWGLVRSRSPRM